MIQFIPHKPKMKKNPCEQNKTESFSFIVSMGVVTTALCLIFFTVQKVFASDDASVKTKIVNDYKNFYSKDRLARMAVGFLSMSAVANSKVDQNIQDWYQGEIRNSRTDNYAETAKFFGEGKYLIPVSILAGGTYYLNSDSIIGNWGLNAARAYTVGLLPMLAMQYTTGASRPKESRGSKWRPFNDSNGVSGHAFVGAVPFLTLARMNNNQLIKYIAYFTSGLTAWSRVNDHAHYTSQAILGWYMAYESVDSVFETNNKLNQIFFMPVIGKDFYGINVSVRW